MHEQRSTTYTEAYNFCFKKGFNYVEVSAKTGNNVASLFETLTKTMVEKEMENDKKLKKKGKIDKSNVTANKSITLEQGKVETTKENKCCK